MLRFPHYVPSHTAGRSFLSLNVSRQPEIPCTRLDQTRSDTDITRDPTDTVQNCVLPTSSRHLQASSSPLSAPAAKPGSLHPPVPYSLSQSQQRLVEPPPCPPHNKGGEGARAPAAPKPRTSHLSRSRRVARIRAILPPRRHRPPVAPWSCWKKRAGSLAAPAQPSNSGRKVDPNRFVLTTRSVARKGWRGGGAAERARQAPACAREQNRWREGPLTPPRLSLMPASAAATTTDSFPTSVQLSAPPPLSLHSADSRHCGWGKRGGREEEEEKKMGCKSP